MLNEKAILDELTTFQRAVFWKLLGRPGQRRDVPIDRLYNMIATDGKTRSPKQQQQYVGALISRINKRLAAGSWGIIIRPGQARRTYRIYTILEASKPRG